MSDEQMVKAAEIAQATEFIESKDKKLLIIDEFPYMVKNNKEIPSILQNLWDNLLKDQNVMIILCGSSMSFIEKEILAEKNPLYGRATGIYKMTQMDFYDAIKFFPKFSLEDKIYAYSILGGIPHYLKEFDDSKTIQKNIEDNILKKGCILYNEIEFLLHQELRETTLYNTIIEAIALESDTPIFTSISFPSLALTVCTTGLNLLLPVRNLAILYLSAPGI